MKVCFASYQAVTILQGGPNTQVRMTAKYLPGFGVDPVLFDPWERFGRKSVDLFHIFAANIGTYHLAREVRGLGIPFVVSPIIYSSHSAAFVRTGLGASRLVQKAWRGSWSDYGLAADICEWASAVLPNTEAERELVVKGLGVNAERARVVPNGVDERFADADPSLFEKKYGVKGFILNVGHIGHERKNVLKLIEALGGIDHPSVIIGRVIRGSYGDACIRKAGKYRQILIIDGLPYESDLLASAYAASDVFALPSLFETPGIAALEAGLAGAKIVITQAGGTREYFGDMAIYVDPYSVTSIRNGILQGLDGKKDARLHAHIRTNYTWRRIAEKTAAVYKGL